MPTSVREAPETKRAALVDAAGTAAGATAGAPAGAGAPSGQGVL